MHFRLVTDVAGPGGHCANMARHVIEGLARGCAPMWREWRLPPLYQSGVQYRLEPGHGQGVEEFALPPVVASRRWGDCDDLTIYRLAELLAAGERARCRAVWRGDGIHVLVRRQSGKLEDPSKVLMMRTQ